jgi:hypothetical protein
MMNVVVENAKAGVAELGVALLLALVRFAREWIAILDCLAVEEQIMQVEVVARREGEIN